MKKICNASMVRKWVKVHSNCKEALDFNPTPGLKGVIINMMEKAIKTEAQEPPFEVKPLRRLVLCFLFGKENEPYRELSSKELANNQWYALSKWVSPEKVDDVWLSRPEFPNEMQEVARTAKQYYRLFAKASIAHSEPVSIENLFILYPLPAPEMLEPLLAPISQVVSDLLKLGG